MLFRTIHPFIRFARIFTVKNDECYPPFLPADCRLFYVLEGSVTIRTKEKCFSLESKDCLLIPEGTMYQTIHSGTQDAILSALNFDYTFHYSHLTQPIAPIPEGSETQFTPLSTPPIEDAPRFHKPLFISDWKEAEFLLQNIISAYDMKYSGYEVSMSANLMQLLHSCYCEGDQNTPLTEKIIQFIRKNYHLPLTNQSLGKQFGYHPNYMNRIIKKSTGLSLHAYLNAIRISRAITLLESGEMSISQTALHVGFADPSYFSRYFKKVTGSAPSAFFRESRKGT